MASSIRAHTLPQSLLLCVGLLTSAPALATMAELPGVDRAACDPLDPAHCLLPFPSNWHTVVDELSVTGRRVRFTVEAMPQNVAGKPIDPSAWNLNDGFSPGAAAITLVPDLDLHRSWGTTERAIANGSLRRVEDRDHIADIGRYQHADAPILILNTRTGERHPFWSELDTHPETTAERSTLILRPAVNYTYGDRYIVILRNLKGAQGNLLVAPETFRGFRDGQPPPLTDTSPTAVRHRQIDALLDEAMQLDATILRGEVHLAWDFTVASRENITERVLHMRDTVFTELGDTNLYDGGGVDRGDGIAPTVLGLTVNDVEHLGRRVISGRLLVPNFLTHDVEIDNRLHSDGQAAAGLYRLLDLNNDGIPERNPVEDFFTVPFDCQVPTGAAINGREPWKHELPLEPVLYAHGLLGRRLEAFSTSTEDLLLDGFVVCATDWLGMSRADLPNVATILGDLTLFPTLVDRSQQGFIAKLLLARWMAHPDGLSSIAEVQGLSPIASGHVEFVGNSQGAIMGGALMTVALDFRRGMLGVPGMNFSTLLNRSVDFEGVYSVGLYAGYPDKIEQQIAFGLMQMLWDRSETNGYAAHTTTGSTRTTAKQILLQVGFADHQVANVSAEVEARTMGASLVTPLVPDTLHAAGTGNTLHWSLEPQFMLPGVAFNASQNATGMMIWRDTNGEPVHGSALVYWYGVGNQTSPPAPAAGKNPLPPGNPTPPNGNLPPRDGHDPHEQPRRDDAASRQLHHFLRTGELLEVCGGAPCLTSIESRNTDR